MYNPSTQEAVPWKISLSFRATNSTLWFSEQKKKFYVGSSRAEKIKTKISEQEISLSHLEN